MRLKVELGEQHSHDNINLTVENQRLTKALTLSRESSAKLLELEHDMEEKVSY